MELFLHCLNSLDVLHMCRCLFVDHGIMENLVMIKNYVMLFNYPDCLNHLQGTSLAHGTANPDLVVSNMMAISLISLFGHMEIDLKTSPKDEYLFMLLCSFHYFTLFFLFNLFLLVHLQKMCF